MPRPRVALDTGLIFSGLAYPGHLFGQILEAWYEALYDLVWSTAVLAEYRRVLVDPEYFSRFNNELAVDEFLELVPMFGIRASDVTVPLPRIRDDHDRIWLEVAIGASANSLVTIDPDFLEDPILIREMRRHGVDIVRPGIFWAELNRP